MSEGPPNSGKQSADQNSVEPAPQPAEGSGERDADAVSNASSGAILKYSDHSHLGTPAESGSEESGRAAGDYYRLNLTLTTVKAEFNPTVLPKVYKKKRSRVLKKKIRQVKRRAASVSSASASSSYTSEERSRKTTANRGAKKMKHHKNKRFRR